MPKIILLFGCLAVMTSCGRYSKVVEAPGKDEKESKKRIYGEVDGPALQSKNVYATPADAAEKAAHIREVVFGRKKSAAAIAAEEASAPVATTANPVDTSAKK